MLDSLKIGVKESTGFSNVYEKNIHIKITAKNEWNHIMRTNFLFTSMFARNLYQKLELMYSNIPMPYQCKSL